jgi:hypothetical protein
LFNHFFIEFIMKKVVFKFPNQFSHLNHQILTFIYRMPRFFGSFIPNLGNLDSRLGAAGHVSSATYFSNLLEDKDKRFKANLTLGLILRFNLRLGGYSIWSASLIAPHIKEDMTTTWGHEHLTTSEQPMKYSEDTFKMEFGRTRGHL